MALNDRELLAKTLQAEAGNQGIGGMLAVGSVIRNRMAQGGSLSDVILAPAQFSAWNKVTGAVGGEQGQDMAAIKPSEDAYAAADAILSGNAPDLTGGATHYYNPSISNPAWGKEKAGGDWTKIGAHIFGKAGDFRTGAAKMNGEQTQKPQGLLGGLLGGQGIGGALGMSDDFRDKLKMAILAGTGDARMDPLISATAARMEERKEERKLQKGINKTIDYFQKKADAGDDLAATMVGALNTQQIDPASAISTYISESTRAVKDTRTAAEKEYDRAAAEGYQGSFMDFLQAKKKEFNIGINTEGADDFTRALMKGMATRYETYQSEADAAEKAMANLNLMGNLVGQDNFYSGPFGNQVTAVRRVATLFGADPEQVADAETFNKIAKDSALQVMGGSLGVGFSNADRDFVEAMVPNIENTKAGNLKIIEVQTKIQNRKIDLARMAEQYAAENGTLKGFRAFITEWRQQNPLFSAAEKAALDPAATAKSTGLSEDAMSFIK